MSKLLSKMVFAGLIILWLTGSQLAKAIEMLDLYQVKVEVSDQSMKARWKAFLVGFKEVLVRKSGSQQVLNAYEVQQAYSKVTSYLQRFEYAVNHHTDANLPFLLDLNFEPRLIDTLIQEAGMPIWGSNRPISILWLALERNFQKEIIKEDNVENSFAQLLAKNAKRRGIPVILPLMDLEDQVNVNVSDIWGRFNSPIIKASERYQADSILIGRVSQLGELWQLKFSYINQGVEKNLVFSEPSIVQLVETLSNRLAELLCEKYCVVETAESHYIHLQIANIQSFNHFKKVQHYLESLSSIRKIEVDQLLSTVVRFNVSLLGDIQSVKDGIELGKKMLEEPAPEKDLFLIQPITQESTLKNIQNNHTETQAVISLQPETVFSQPIEEQSQALSSKHEEPTILYYRWIE